MNRRGVERDRRVRDLLDGDGWFAICSRGSHGAADIVAIKDGERPQVIQVKSTAGGPYERFGPNERRELSRAARIGGADALLAWWPPRGHLAFIPEDQWPDRSS